MALRCLQFRRIQLIKTFLCGTTAWNVCAKSERFIIMHLYYWSGYIYYLKLLRGRRHKRQTLVYVFARLATDPPRILRGNPLLVGKSLSAPSKSTASIKAHHKFQWITVSRPTTTRTDVWQGIASFVRFDIGHRSLLLETVSPSIGKTTLFCLHLLSLNLISLPNLTVCFNNIINLCDAWASFCTF